MESQQMETIPESMNFRDNGMNAVNATTTLARYDTVRNARCLINMHFGMV